MDNAVIEEIKKRIRDVPDFPKPGILFKDITTLIKDGEYFNLSVDLMLQQVEHVTIDHVAAIEARGFIFGAAMAIKLGKGLIPIRKPGKLPAQTGSEEYQLEYGTDSLEIHTDAVNKGDHVLIVDDLLATGGTALATIHLIEKLGGKVAGLSFLIELAFLNGRTQLEAYPMYTLLTY